MGLTFRCQFGAWFDEFSPTVGSKFFLVSVSRTMSSFYTISESELVDLVSW